MLLALFLVAAQLVALNTKMDRFVTCMLFVIYVLACRLITELHSLNTASQQQCMYCLKVIIITFYNYLFVAVMHLASLQSSQQTQHINFNKNTHMNHVEYPPTASNLPQMQTVQTPQYERVPVYATQNLAKSFSMDKVRQQAWKCF
jgi:hypothetical protein